MRDMTKVCIGIAVVIPSTRIKPMRESAYAKEAIGKVIAEEKEWIAKSVALGFVKHGVAPEDGSSVEYEVIDLEDGSVKVEGWQYVKEGVFEGLAEREVEEKAAREKTRERVLSAIQEAAGVTLEELKGKSRTRMVVFCRFIAAKELYSRTCMSMSDIAELLGRDVKSVRYYMGMYEVNSRNFREFRELAGRIAGLLEGCGRSPE